MKVFRSFIESVGIPSPVITTGSFDGVHIGHKTIITRLKTLAGIYNGESVLITFDPHPRKVLYPDTAGRELKLINSLEEKLDLLEEAGLDNVIIIKFTKDFSKISSEEFVRDILRGILNARVIVAGFNHHFGFNKEGDYRQLWDWREKYGFEAEEIPEQEVEHETVSSTKIRKAIGEGYIQRANAYLDHYYIIIGKSEFYTISKTHRLPQFFRIILNEESKLLPPPGIYAVSVEEGPVRFRGMVIISMCQGITNDVLLNIFGDPCELPPARISIFFHKKMHGAVNLAASESIQKVLLLREEIIELIY